MRRKRLKATGAVILVLALLLAVRALAAPLAEPALGYVAKVVCSEIFIAGATRAQAVADLPDDPLARMVRTRVDVARERVDASIPLLARRSAHHRSGLGCTLRPVRGHIAAARAPRSVDDTPARRAHDPTLPWPEGDSPAVTAQEGVAAALLRDALSRAFEEPDRDVPRRTRAVIVVRGGRIIAERYAEGYSADSRFAGWSMTKSVMNALVGILAGHGRLDLEADALHPEWLMADDPRRGIRLSHLMQMSSGLDFDESYTPRGGATRMLFNTRDAAATAAAAPLAHPPGTVWYYSSGTTNIVSDVVRRTFAGDDAAYHSFPRQHLFDVIGMHSAVLELDAAGTFVGSSFMYATARDWARFGLLFLREGVWNGERLLPAGWARYSVTPAPAAPLGRYGAHWWLNAGEAADRSRRPWPDLPAEIAWASGYQGQFVALVPSHDLVVVRLGVTAREGAFSLEALLRDVLAATSPTPVPGAPAHRSPADTPADTPAAGSDPAPGAPDGAIG
jgi:CubicO group peptidase (beta-lactamase class C family)